MIEAEKVSTYCPSRQRRDLIPSAGLHPGAESFELQGQLSSIPGQRSNDYPVSNIPFQIRRRPQGSLVEGMGGVRCFKLVDRTIAPAQYLTLMSLSVRAAHGSLPPQSINCRSLSEVFSRYPDAVLRI